MGERHDDIFQIRYEGTPIVEGTSGDMTFLDALLDDEDREKFDLIEGGYPGT